jgi:ankyrin repeat protein
MKIITSTTTVFYLLLTFGSVPQALGAAEVIPEPVRIPCPYSNYLDMRRAFLQKDVILDGLIDCVFENRISFLQVFFILDLGNTPLHLATHFDNRSAFERLRQDGAPLLYIGHSGMKFNIFS